MNEPRRISAGRGRILNGARPKWVMAGLEWDGPGVRMRGKTPYGGSYLWDGWWEQKLAEIREQEFWTAHP